MLDKVKQFINKEHLIEDKDTIIAGISGGADSICLLSVLSKLKDEYGLRIIVVHINHQLRLTAERDLKFTKEICEKFGVEFIPVYIDVNKYVEENHVSTEEAGRILRYKAFATTADNMDITNYKIAVAHNMDDNAETMMLNMIRGSGIRGITGILPRRDNIVRPLLCVTRAEIEEYLSGEGLEYCTDETNMSDDYSRNKIRHYIIPVCEAINERALNRFSELSDQVTEAEDYLVAKTTEALTETVTSDTDGYLHIAKDKLDALHPYLKKRVLLEAIAQAASMKKDIGAVHVAMISDLFQSQVGRSVMLPYDLLAVREYEGVRLCRSTYTSIDKEIEEMILSVPGDTEFNNSYIFKTAVFDMRQEYLSNIPDSPSTRWVDYDKLKKAIDDKMLSVRCRKEGDTICINGSGSTKKLKNYFIDQKIPLEQRNKIPVIAVGQDIVWIVGYRLSETYKITGDTKQILEIKCFSND